uniref:pyridoxal kinase n=1 Tax=Ananas comosus var. bracteatus TaxID=296719 RepID=A0A6V7Q5B6_ANACO|nr:unnamed protein product [Ananas comosus var. bracteatus]
MRRGLLLPTLRNQIPLRFPNTNPRRILRRSSMAPPPILSLALPSETGRVLSIQSHTVQGYVGNKSAVFPLQLLGYDVDPINSVQFSNHTGKLLYITSFQQSQNQRPDNMVVPVASMLTPNQFEAELLTGLRITSEQDGLAACNILHAAGPPKVVITSMQIADKLLLIGSHQKKRNSMLMAWTALCNALACYWNVGLVPILENYEKKKREAGPSTLFRLLAGVSRRREGTGDLMTALLLGWSNKYPDNLERASEIAASSLQALLQRTLSDYQKQVSIRKQVV